MRHKFFMYQTKEEVDIAAKGGNFGWSKYEGLGVNPQYAGTPDIPNVIPPIFEYGALCCTVPRLHSSSSVLDFYLRCQEQVTYEVDSYRTGSEGSAVIGGYIYRGTRDYTLFGRYVFGDHSAGTSATFEKMFERLKGLMVATEAADGAWNKVHVGFLCGGNCPSSNFQLIFSFYEDANRDMYLLGPGGIFRINEREICGLASGNSTAIPATAGQQSTTSSGPSTSSPSFSTSTPSTSSSANGRIAATTNNVGGVADSSQPIVSTGVTRSTSAATISSLIPGSNGASSALLPLAGLFGAILMLFSIV